MLVITNKALLNAYTNISDKDANVKNFRLFYEQKPTNLIWYDGRIIYIPKEYFELKNLVNVDIKKMQRCSLYPSDIKLLRELQKQEVNFILEGNLGELFKRIGMCGLIFDDEIAVELVDDNDYSDIIEPIYLGNGVWINQDR